MKKKIFIVDDEPKIGDLFVTVLSRDGYTPSSFVNPNAMLDAVKQGEGPDLILADLMMPGMSGMDLLEALKRMNRMVPVIIMTGHSSVQSAVDAMRLGAFHYLQKPVNLEEMRALIKKALALYDKPATAPQPGKQKKKKAEYPVSSLLGTSSAIQEIKSTIHQLRDIPNTTILIRGETGTGKNLVAKTIHSNSLYNAGEFVEINCAALPENLLEAELFGYEKGAFTDARDAKPGLLEIADGGTLFLDEIDSMSLALQAKLLSFLESRTFRRLGGVAEIKVTTRLICATNAGLESKIAEKKFRPDLFYRINVVGIAMPPLRIMGGDLMDIAEELLKSYCKEMNKDLAGFTRDAEQKLKEHSWPGNVRELRNTLERAVIFCTTPLIEAEDLILSPAFLLGDFTDGDRFSFPAGRTLEDLEQHYIRHTLESSNSSYAEVADILGISKKTLWEKRKRYNLDEAIN